MSEVIILEFAGVTPDQYKAVNKVLGVDAMTGEGDWPAPLQNHVAAVGEGGLVVVEVWESQDAQAAFMVSPRVQRSLRSACPSRPGWNGSN